MDGWCVGSIVAFLKLAGKMGSKPLTLPGRHLINSGLLATNMATLGAFVTAAPSAPAIAAMCLTGNAALSFIKGYTTTAAIGGAGACYVIRIILEMSADEDFRYACCDYGVECVLWFRARCGR